MKRVILLFSTLAVSLLYCQEGRVGINTSSPKTTMDVNGKMDALGATLPTDMTGLQAPRLSRAELTSKGEIYGSDQKGALVYIKDTLGGDALLSRVNVKNAGYYYFDGSVWVKIVIGAENPTITANNGLTKTADNIKLGGTLVEETTIANAGFNTLITGSGNVGIGVTDPSEKLDISGTLRARGVQELSFDTTDKVMVIQSNGYVKKVPLQSLQPADKFTLYQIFDDISTTPVNDDISGTWTNGQSVNNVDLGITVPVTIPANTDSKVIVNYSVPMGLSSSSSCADNKLSYYGIRFLKGSTEQQMGSRKFSFPGGAIASRMSTISGIFVEEITNNTASPITINYTLNGYLEFAASTITSPCSVRFNMWSATGQNFNWGKAAITVQLFTKPL